MIDELAVFKQDTTKVKNLEHLLSKLQQFVGNVEVAEFNKETNQTIYSQRDLSATFVNAHHTCTEIALLAVLFFRSFDKDYQRDYERLLWADIPENCESETEVRTYIDYISSKNTNLLGAVTRRIFHMVEKTDKGKPGSVAKQKKEDLARKIQDTNTAKLLDSGFSPEAQKRGAPKTFADPEVVGAFHVARDYRNASAHLGENTRKSGKASASLEEELEYWTTVHLYLVFFILATVERFFDLIADFLKIDDNANLLMASTDEQELAAMGKAAINTDYIRQTHEFAKAKLRALFHGTGLDTLPVVDDIQSSSLLESIPEISLKRDGASGTEDIGTAAMLLADDTAQRRMLLLGESGSGKTVMIMRMLLRNQPRLMPIYIDMESEGASFKDKNLFKLLLRRKVVGQRNITYKGPQRQAAIRHLEHLLSEGSAVFFIDGLDSHPKLLPNVLERMREHPDCCYVLTSQDWEIGDPVASLSDEGFTVYRLLPMMDGQVKKCLRLVSTSMSNKDHSSQLWRQIKAIATGDDMVRQPRLLMLMAHLFESLENRNTSEQQNRMAVYATLVSRINLIDGMDADERDELLGLPFIQEFLKAFSCVVEFGKELLSAYYKKRPWQEVVQRHKEAFLANGHELRDLFELMELLGTELSPTEEGRALFDAPIIRTLVTVALLRQGLGSPDNNKPHRLNELLVTLAQATATLPLEEIRQKNVKDLSKTEKAGRVVYRPSPRYIVFKYLWSYLVAARRSPDNIDTRPLFHAVALSGIDLLYAQLFEHFWMRRWLIEGEKKDEKLCPLLMENCANRVELALLFMRQLQWTSVLKDDKARATCQQCLRQLIISSMNDAERERLVERMKKDGKRMKKDGESDIDAADRTYYSNMAIASMTSPTLAKQYDSRTAMLDEEIEKHLIALSSSPYALRILISWLPALMEEAIRNNATDHTRRILVHLLKCGVLTNDNLKQDFWNCINQFISSNNMRPVVLQLLDDIPPQQIDPTTAACVYDEPVFRFLCDYKEEERKRNARWIDFPAPKADMTYYRTATKKNAQAGRRQLAFTFYCQPNAFRYVVATEWINNMPEGKFCRIKGLDQWFYVEDIQDLHDRYQEADGMMTDGEMIMTHLVELTLYAQPSTPRPQTGTITIGSVSAEKRCPYIHLFEKAEHPHVVLRIEHPQWVDLLRSKEVQDRIKANPTVTWGGEEATIVGIRVLPVSPSMRFAVLKPVAPPRSDKDAWQKSPMTIERFPHEGYISFYDGKSEDRGSKLLAGEIISGAAQVRYYHPVCDPVFKDLGKLSSDVQLQGVVAQKTTDDVNTVLSIPECTFDNARYYYDTPHYPHRYVIEWYEPQQPVPGRRFFCLDDSVRLLWTHNLQPIRIYREGSDEPLSIKYKSLSAVVDLEHPDRYHRQLLPLLMDEWLQEGRIPAQQADFCKRKGMEAWLLETYLKNYRLLSGGWSPEVRYVIASPDNDSLLLCKSSELAQKIADGDYTRFERFIAPLPKQHENIAPGMLVVCLDNEVKPLGNNIVSKLAKQYSSGFMKGRVEEKRTPDQNNVIIMPETEKSSVFLFAQRQLDNGSFLKAGDEVCFLPVVLPKTAYAKTNDNGKERRYNLSLSAKYVRIIKQSSNE